jgi:hypothetical protein
MPKYSGIVDLKGTIGNLSFYKRKGVNCVRRPGGFTKERLQTDPRLRRVREHNTEFGAQSMASKSLRTALAPLRNFCDGTLHNRLMGIGARVTALTEGIHGQRPVAFSRMKPILDKLQLNENRPLESSLAMLIRSVSSATRVISKLQLDIDIPVVVKAPKGSTHFRLVHALGVISDVEYEPALGGFVPIAYQVDGLSARSHSDYISLKQQTANITFETTLPTGGIPDKATVVEVVGIDFYQVLGLVYEPFTQGRAAMVVGVF